MYRLKEWFYEQHFAAHRVKTTQKHFIRYSVEFLNIHALNEMTVVNITHQQYFQWKTLYILKDFFFTFE